PTATEGDLQPEQDSVSREEWPIPSRFEETAPDPSHRSFAGAIGSDPGIGVATGAEPERDEAPLAEATQQSTPTALEEVVPDPAPQVSSRALSLGLDLDAAP